MAKITIKDIAKKAGVSTTAVSFAFNKPDRLGAETVQKILEIADELGYIPNPIARSMTTGRTGTIGVLVPQPLPEALQNPFLMEFLEGVGEICTRDGYSLMLIPPLQGSLKRAIEYSAVDGFITLGLEEEKSVMLFLRQMKLPFVVVDSDAMDEVPSVNIDDEFGAKKAMQYVLSNGHRNIAIVAIRSGKQAHYKDYVGTLRHRILGYQAALEEYGLSIDNPNIQLVESDNTIQGGKQIFQKILAFDPAPTAVVTMSDIIAIGIYEAARDGEIAIPEALSVVGFDDIPISKLVCPPLTTISQPTREKGRNSAELLAHVIEGDPEHPHIVLPTQLAIRDSVISCGTAPENKDPELPAP